MTLFIQFAFLHKKTFIFMASLDSRRFEYRLLGGDSPREGGPWGAMFKRSKAHWGSISIGDLGKMWGHLQVWSDGLHIPIYLAWHAAWFCEVRCGNSICVSLHTSGWGGLPFLHSNWFRTVQKQTQKHVFQPPNRFLEAKETRMKAALCLVNPFLRLDQNLW